MNENRATRKIVLVLGNTLNRDTAAISQNIFTWLAYSLPIFRWGSN